jgi:hypothetical protein
MGIGISQNVANAVASVTNSIQSTSTADSNQIGSCVQSISLNRCVIRGDLDINSTCNITATSQNIINKLSTANLSNNISQDLLQTAKSTVQGLGLGIADANNVVNAFIRNNNAIINTVAVKSNQNASNTTIFECRDSTIDGSLQLGVNTDINFLSTQVLNLKETDQIVSNISQQVSQTATSTVSGIVGLIIAIAILVVAIGWVLLRPLQLAMGNRVLMIFIVLLLITGIFLAMYYLQLPPFFNPPSYCLPIPTALGGCKSDVECVNVDTRTIKMKTPPIRYSYDIIGQGDTSLGQSTSGFTPGLIQLAIARRGGWNEIAFNYFASSFTPQGLPNPLIKSGTSYRTNVNQWQTYISNRDNAAKGRYLLCRDLEIDTYAYIYDNEPCFVNGREVFPPDATCYKFVPDVPPPGNSVESKINSGGTLTGNIGICNTPSQRIQNIGKIAGVIVGGVAVIGFVMFMILYRKPQTSFLLNIK